MIETPARQSAIRGGHSRGTGTGRGGGRGRGGNNRLTSRSSKSSSSAMIESPTRQPAVRGGSSRGSVRGRGNSYATQPAARAGSTGLMQNNGNHGHGNRNTNHTSESNSTYIRAPEPWRDWQEVSLRLYGLPSNLSTLDLWEAFNGKGTITFIELFQDRDRPREWTAMIRFDPPPQNDFWTNGPYRFVVKRDPPGGNFLVTAKIVLLKRRRNWMIQSPVRRLVFYPQAMKLLPSTFDFGFMVDSQTMMHMRSATPLSNPTREVVFKVDLLRRKLTIFFPCHFSGAAAGEGMLDRINNYMVWIPFEHIEKIHSVDIDDNHTSFILSLDSPPCFFRQREDVQASHYAEASMWSEMDTWYRQTDIIYDPATVKNSPVSLSKGEVEIDIGRWTTYRFVIPKTSSNGPSVLRNIHEALKDFNIPILPLDGFNIVPRVDADFWQLIDQEAHPSFGVFSLKDPNSFRLPFEIRYQLEVCISQGVFLEHNLTAEFLTALTELVQKDATKAQSILEYFAEMETRVHDPMTIFDNEEAQGRTIRDKIPKYCDYVRKATVTPSGIYYSTPTVETTNRVTREYSRVSDRFLRVQFTDEKTEGRISSTVDKVKNNELYTRVFRTLQNGIVIGDRKYEFLAYGNSQFRQNGAYFFCPNDQVACESIRNWMGSFSHIKVIAKYAARLGQCFSTTRAIHGAIGLDIDTIQDIKRNGYTFTDGVGKISSLLAQMIASELSLPLAIHVPSAFQFRLGGCKGILVVWPDVTGKRIEIRPSQQKFQTVYSGLEIIRCSQFSTATLNRQTITILSALEVPNEIFTDMLTKQLSNYQTAMTDRKMALSLLQKWIDENSMTIVIASMILNGFMDSREPFVMSLLHLWRAWSIKLLKEKAKIMVEKGAFVFGCIDETGTLKGHQNDAKYGSEDGPKNVDSLPQIFLQVPESEDREKYRVIKGACVLGRNPSLHPGDIRVVYAVDVPALHHLRDVVVFPQLGDRDIPSMCSGGDLDGDDFFVIWDEGLIPKQWNLAPMNYEAPPAIEKPNGPVEVQDLMKFFVRFMKNDSLPTIAHAHLAQSDYLAKGVKDPKCLKLAELHSKAVDYVKSGEAAVMPRSLRPRMWPHFMEKKYKPKEQIYNSEKILGLLYNQVEAVDFIPQYTEPFDTRILRAYKLDSEMLKTARKIKSEYDTAMKRIMAQMEIKTEFEVYTTFILSRPRVGSDYKQQEEMGGISNSLKDRFRDICIDAAGGSKEFDKLAPFVAAMYRVTWEEMQIALTECKTYKSVGGKEVPKRKMIPKFMPLISFPWIFHEVLGRIAAGTDAQADLEDLGFNFLNTASVGGPRRKRVVSDEAEEEVDYVQTEKGAVHRGQLLDLFSSDEEEEDVDASTDLAGDGHDMDLSRNTRERNLEVETRKLDSAGYIAPHDETNLDDEFKGIELDGFLNPSREVRPVSSFDTFENEASFQPRSSTAKLISSGTFENETSFQPRPFPASNHTSNAQIPNSSTVNIDDFKNIFIFAKGRSEGSKEHHHHEHSPTGSAPWSGSEDVDTPASGSGDGASVGSRENENDSAQGKSSLINLAVEHGDAHGEIEYEDNSSTRNGLSSGHEQRNEEESEDESEGELISFDEEEEESAFEKLTRLHVGRGGGRGGDGDA